MVFVDNKNSLKYDIRANNGVIKVKNKKVGVFIKNPEVKLPNVEYHVSIDTYDGGKLEYVCDTKYKLLRTVFENIDKIYNIEQEQMKKYHHG